MSHSQKIWFAVIAPTPLLDLFSDQGDVQMCIAPIALADPLYAAYFKKQHHSFTILDNGVFEVDEPLSTSKLLKALYLTTADEIVAPDLIGNSKESLNLLDQFLKEFLPQKSKGISIQAVIQGQTLKEIEQHYLHLLDRPEIDTIGVTHSFNLLNSFGKTLDRTWSRIMLIDYFRRQHAAGKYPQIYKPLHLMGMVNPIELYYQTINNIIAPYVRSNDSSAPVQCGKYGVRITASGISQEKISEKLNFSWDPKKSLPPAQWTNIQGCIQENINQLKKFSEGLR